MKKKTSPTSQLKTIYQLATPHSHGRLLELLVNDEDSVIDDEWPADSRTRCRLTATSRDFQCESFKSSQINCVVSSFQDPLPFSHEAFDMIVLHKTLDKLASLTASTYRLDAVEDWLIRVSHHLKPNGTISGCLNNRSSPRHWHSRQRAEFGIYSCRNILIRAGLKNVKIFNVIPDLSAPNSIISTDFSASRRFFRRDLESQFDHYSLSKYLARRLFVESGLNRFMEGSLFFTAQRLC